jgi:hypothetical protein
MGLKYDYYQIKKEIGELLRQREADVQKYPSLDANGEADIINIFKNIDIMQGYDEKLQEYDEILYKMSMLGLTPYGIYLLYHGDPGVKIYKYKLFALKDYFMKHKKLKSEDTTNP